MKTAPNWRCFRIELTAKAESMLETRQNPSNKRTRARAIEAMRAREAQLGAMDSNHY